MDLWHKVQLRLRIADQALVVQKQQKVGTTNWTAWF